MTPKDLTDREYALNVLEEILGWPGKGNVEMMMDCLRSVGKCKKLSPYQSFVYLNRAIKLAKDQGQEVNRFWFQEGEYINVRPESKTALPDYKRIDRAALEKEQSTPEWKAANELLRKKLREFAFGKKMDDEHGMGTTKTTEAK